MSSARCSEPVKGIAAFAGERAVYEAKLIARLPTGSYSAGSGLHDLIEVPRARLLGSASRLSFYVSGRHTVHGAADPVTVDAI